MRHNYTPGRPTSKSSPALDELFIGFDHVNQFLSPQQLAYIKQKGQEVVELRRRSDRKRAQADAAIARKPELNLEGLDRKQIKAAVRKRDDEWQAIACVEEEQRLVQGINREVAQILSEARDAAASLESEKGRKTV